MSRFVILFILSLLAIFGYGYVTYQKDSTRQEAIQTEVVNESADSGTGTTNISNESEKVSVIAQNLDTPWALAFLPDKSVLFTERKGTVRLVDANGNLQSSPVATISSAREIGEGGLLGITLHPQFPVNNYVYLYYTYSSSRSNTQNRVVRMTYSNGQLTDEKIIVDAIPGAANHNGGRIKFGPDGYLYIGTGDAQKPSNAQDTNSLAGKILRVTDNGDPALGNPFNNRVYSYGHRNVQGLAWDKDGNLWATEHGPSGAESCCDELNKIEIGKNYGWPDIQGNATKPGMITPVRNSGSGTWAPSGMAFKDGSFYFSGLRGQTLYQAVINENSVTDFKEYLKNQYGRLREVVVGPDTMLYVTTSNQDGRGTPKKGDDKILRINPSML